MTWVVHMQVACTSPAKQSSWRRPASEGNGDFGMISTHPVAHTTVFIYCCRDPKHQQTRSGSKVGPRYYLGRYFVFTAVRQRVIWDINSCVPIDYCSAGALLNSLHELYTPSMQHIKATLHSKSIRHEFTPLNSHGRPLTDRHCTSWISCICGEFPCHLL